MEHEEWVVMTYAAEPEVMVRAGDRLVPERVEVTIRQGNEAARHRRRPTARVRFEVRAGGVGCTAFNIESAPGDRPIRSSDLALINLDVLALEAFDHFGEPIDEPTRRRMRSVLDQALHETATGTVGELRDVALLYLGARERRKAAEEVRAGMAYPNMTKANRRIRAARDKGLIPPVGASDRELEAVYRRLKEGQNDGEEG